MKKQTRNRRWMLLGGLAALGAAAAAGAYWKKTHDEAYAWQCCCESEYETPDTPPDSDGDD